VPYPKGQAGVTCWWRSGSLTLPRDLNARQQHLLKELAKEEPEPHTLPEGSPEHDEWC